MRALVIGASGQVGAALAARLAERGHTVVGTHGRVPQAGTVPLDVADAVATARLIEAAQADWVFCPAGLTYVDYCENHREEAFRINCDGPADAARASARRGAGFVFYSTDYVFDGEAGPYAEDDPVRPISVYGESKLAGERAVREANARAIVVRTMVVYGPEPQGKNSVYQILKRARASEPVRAPIDQVTSPTYNGDLAAASVELAERDITGVFHVAGPELVDRFAFTRLVCEIFGVRPSVLEPIKTSDLGLPAARPLKSGFHVDRVRSVVATPLRPPAEGLRAMRRALEDPEGAEGAEGASRLTPRLSAG